MEHSEKRSVLVVDDHADIRGLVTEYLQASNFTVLSAVDGHQALHILQRGGIDMVILDLNMPGTDGFEVCRQIRKSSALPILVLSARSEDLDKILVLELGADDYLTKPFNPRELVARVQATFRRMNWDQNPLSNQAKSGNYGTLRLDSHKRQAWVKEQILALTPIEFSLLSCLAENAGHNMTRQQLLNKVWGEDYYGDERTVDAHIRALRSKLKSVEESLRPIVSVWGVGYRFEI